MAQLRQRLLQPLDILPLAVLRVGFGLIMLVGVLRFLARGWVEEFYLRPAMHFSYYGFEWLRPLPAWGLYLVFALMALCAACVALGLAYRAAMAGFFLSFSYVELLDKTYYLNHYYFVSLLSFLLIFLPLNRAYSLDAWLRPNLHSRTAPAWALWAVRLQLGIVYFYAGVAKLNADWLLEALPLRIWLRAHTGFPLLGPLFDTTAMAYLMSWAGAAFDLSIPFLLAWRRTRPLAYLAVIAFHALTGALFNIGMFPAIMIACTLVFFDGDQLRRLFRLATPPAPAEPAARPARRPAPRLPLALLLSAFFLTQALLPLRHMLYPGDVHWTEEGFRFSWKVMVVEKTGAATFFVREPRSGREWVVFPNEYLSAQQEKQMSFQPDMILQFAQFLAARYREQGLGDVEVRAEVYVSLNGRPRRLLIDPQADLAQEPSSLWPRPWILR